MADHKTTFNISSGATERAQPPTLEQKNIPPKTVEQTFHDLAKHYEHIVIAEKHYDDGNAKIYNDPGFYKGLDTGGITHIALELPIELQSMIDAYYDQNHEYFGLSDKDKLTSTAILKEIGGYNFSGRSYTAKDIAKEVAQTIDHARAQGLKIIAMDDKANIRDDNQSPLETMAEYIRTTLNAKGITEAQLRQDLEIEDTPDLDPYDFLIASEVEASAYLNENERAELKAIQGQYGQAQRMYADEAWHNHLQEALPEGARVVAIIGASHAENIIKREGLDERLGGDEKVATVRLTSNEQDIQAQQIKQKDYQYGGLQPATDTAHMTIYTDDMTMKSTDKISIESFSSEQSAKIQSSAPEANTETQIDSQKTEKVLTLQ